LPFELQVVRDGVHELVGDEHADVRVLHLDAPGVVLDRDEPLDIGMIHAHREHEGAPASGLGHRVRALAEEVHEGGRPGGVVDRRIDGRSFRTEDGEIGAHAAARAVDHRGLGDAAVDPLEAVLLDRDHVAIGERGPAPRVDAPRPVHDAAPGDKPEIEQEFQEAVVPVFLVLLNGCERPGDAVPHVHRPLLGVREIFGAQHVCREVVVLVIVAAVEGQVHHCIVHRLRTLDVAYRVSRVHGGNGGGLLVGHGAISSL